MNPDLQQIKQSLIANPNYKKPISPHLVKEKLKEISPCVLEQLECTYESRMKAKITHKKEFNSILQIAHSFYPLRNHTDRIKGIVFPK